MGFLAAICGITNHHDSVSAHITPSGFCLQWWPIFGSTIFRSHQCYVWWVHGNGVDHSSSSCLLQTAWPLLLSSLGICTPCLSLATSNINLWVPPLDCSDILHNWFCTWSYQVRNPKTHWWLGLCESSRMFLTTLCVRVMAMERRQFTAGRWPWDGSDQLSLSADIIGTLERDIPPHNQKLCRLFARNHNVLYSSDPRSEGWNVSSFDPKNLWVNGGISPKWQIASLSICKAW